MAPAPHSLYGTVPVPELNAIWREIAWRDLVALPWRRYEIMTRLSPAEVVALIRGATKPNQWLGFGLELEPEPPRPFSGRVTADGFIVSRRHWFWNYPMPVVIGRLGWAPRGTRICITMRYSWFLMAFWILWMTFFVWYRLTVRIHARDVLGNLAQVLALLVGIPAFAYLACTVAFDWQARWAKARLDELLSGDIYSARHGGPHL